MKHYQRWQKNGDPLDWRDRFISANPPKYGLGFIPLTKGKHAIVDDYWYDYLMQWKWCFTAGGYAVRRGENGGLLQMHRVINDTPVGLFTDHLSTNRLDNRQENLRDCNKQENGANMRKRPGKSVYKGVDQRSHRWRARLMFNHKTVYIGAFNTEREAALAYNQKALELFGSFARLNDVV